MDFDQLVRQLAAGRIPVRQAAPAHALTADLDDWHPEVLKEALRARLVASDVSLGPHRILQVRAWLEREDVEIATGDVIVLSAPYAVGQAPPEDARAIQPADEAALRSALREGPELCGPDVLIAYGEVPGKGRAVVGIARVESPGARPAGAGRISCPYFDGCPAKSCQVPISGLPGTCRERLGLVCLCSRG